MTLRCDVLAVGTELLLGQIIDSNSAWIGGELAANGIDSLVQVKVGDNVGRIETQLRRLLDSADAVIMCGGLGPTHDDLTRDAIAAVMGVDLVTDDAVAEVIRAMFESRGRRMAENNLRQAQVPVGATIIPQTRGTAPGLICPISVNGVDKVVYAVPGVPHEMYDMVHRAILPDLRRRSGDDSVIASRVLRTWGESESGLNERLDHVIEQLEGPDTPTLAFLASGWEGLKVRLTHKAPTIDECTAQLDHWERVVRDELGDLVFGTDGDTMESVVLDLCRQRGLTLATAESVTGGLVGARLTAIPGASDVFRGRDRQLRHRGQADVARRGGGARRERGGGSPNGPRRSRATRSRHRAVAHRRRRPRRAGRPAGRNALHGLGRPRIRRGAPRPPPRPT